MNDLLYPKGIALRFYEPIDINDEDNVVVKPWGYEKLIVSTEIYSLKLLYCANQVISSNGAFHYHKHKDETFYVLDGIIMLEWLHGTADNFVGKPRCIELSRNETFRIQPYTRHRFRSVTATATFLEVASQHSFLDSFKES